MQAHIVDIHQRRIYPATLHIEGSIIRQIEELDHLPKGAGFLLPGFVDAHVHIESSMLPPTEFARMAVVHGTVATVSDPHEIANVLGSAGVHYMLDNASNTPFKFCFGAPSCVPATDFETAGAVMDAAEVTRLLEHPDIGYLSEMMNFPGVLMNDAAVLAKIAAAQQLGKPVDGHAPGLRGDDAQRYFGAGITTDHECFAYAEGREKALLGVKILIREGSAAKNFDVLWPLLNEFPTQIMFCSDDKHPDDLVKGHINLLVARAIAEGCDLFDTLRAACLNPVEHYGLKVGLLREGDPADFILVHDLDKFEVQTTWINGIKVADKGKSLLPRLSVATPNQFVALPKTSDQFVIQVLEPDLMWNEGSVFPFAGNQVIRKAQVIAVTDGQIVTGRSVEILTGEGNIIGADIRKDVLLITVVNRYEPDSPPAMGLVRGFGLQNGALASSVAHDSHNIVAVGVSAEALCSAVNAIIEVKGGVAATDDWGNMQVIPLPIAGLMSDQDGYTLAQTYQTLDAWVKETLGCVLTAPFMSLSFLALPVIPSLKITDLGLFDVDQFEFTELFF
jgi:adenine deaminase